MSLALYLSALKLSRTTFVTWAIILLLHALLVTYLYDSVKNIAGLQETMEAHRTDRRLGTHVRKLSVKRQYCQTACWMISAGKWWCL